MLHKPFAVAALLAASCGAQAASDADLAAIRSQIDEMKKSYEQRIAALEARAEEQEATLRRVLILLVDWVENGSQDTAYRTHAA